MQDDSQARLKRHCSGASPKREPTIREVPPCTSTRTFPRHIFGWHSPRLGLDMPIVATATAATRCSCFPTAQADFLENERFYLIKAIEPHIFAGSVPGLLDRQHQPLRVDEQGRLRCPSRRGARRSTRATSRRRSCRTSAASWAIPARASRSAGASFGAFHAANQFFRRPDLFDTLIAMSGFYDLEPDYTNGYVRRQRLLQQPDVRTCRNMSDRGTLDAPRDARQIHIVTGQGAYEAPHALASSSRGVLWDKGIPHNLDMWGHDVNHDWPWWRKMLHHYIGEPPRLVGRRRRRVAGRGVPRFQLAAQGFFWVRAVSASSAALSSTSVNGSFRARLLVFERELDLPLRVARARRTQADVLARALPEPHGAGEHRLPLLQQHAVAQPHRALEELLLLQRVAPWRGDLHHVAVELW